MTITYFHISAQNGKSVGLKQITFRDIGSTVVLIGKNGAGKSRILGQLKQVLHPLNQAHAINPSTPNHSVRLCISGAKAPIAIDAIPQELRLSDPDEKSPEQKREAVRRFRNEVTGATLANATLAHMEGVIKRDYYCRHPEREVDDDEAEQAAREAASLRALVKDLLDLELGLNINDQLTVSGRNAATAGLSYGQCVLMQIAALIHANVTTSDHGAVLLMDEPENHLHPSAVIDAISRLAAVGVQTWIATHSIPLIAHMAALDPKSLWYVCDGTAQRVGRNPATVLEGLVGPKHIAALQDFIGLPRQLAALQFSAQCLSEPTTAAFRPNDPQVTQISNSLSSHAADGHRIRVVDFGAGRGRLLEGLVTDYPDVQFEYFAYDIPDADAEAAAACNATITAIFGDDKVRRFEGLTALRNGLDAESVDVVILCNVLHEIPPEEWLNIFGKEGALTALLKDTGYVLIVEDQRIPTGERAHRYGFLVFDEPDLKQLFAVREQDVEDRLFVRTADPHGRLTAHRINKQLLARHSAAHTTAAIRSLRDRSLEALARMHVQTDQSSGSSHLYGFWCQQFTNAYLFLKDQGAH